MEVSAPRLPVLRSGDHPVPSEHAFELFHDTNAPMFDTNVLEQGVLFPLESIDYVVDDLVVGQLETGPYSMRRNDPHLRDGTTDWIMVQIHHSGGVRGVAGREDTLDLGPDTVGIVDLSEPIAGWHCGGLMTCVAVPRHRIDDADCLAAVRAFDRSTPQGRVLSSGVAELWRQLEHASLDDSEGLAGGIAETVNAALSQDAFTPSDKDLGLAMRDFLKVNLASLDLDVPTLCATFHCSRASVYRLFEPHGGVHAYIRDQRLLRCFNELVRPAKLPRRISEIATRWGFENPSHFNRIFKAKFGLPPSDIIAPATIEPPRVSGPSEVTARMREFHAWIRAA